MAIKVKCPECGNKMKLDDSMGLKNSECTNCKFAFQVPASKIQKTQQAQTDRDAENRTVAEAARLLEEKKQSIVISTGGLTREYRILTIIFAAGIQKYGGKGLFDGDASRLSNKKYNSMIQSVYNEAISIFREKGVQAGADAIIHAKFDIEQIELFEKGIVGGSGTALRIQVFCTGTAVKYL